MMTIVSAQTGDVLNHLITLSQEYVTWMLAAVREHYPDLDVNEFASEHTYDDIRKKFPGEHVPPDGGLWIVLNGDEVCGCIALGRLTREIGEVRTLYVRPACRGMGVARQLVDVVLHEARTLGYRAVRLDTLRFMTEAQTLYRSYGFSDIEPYLDLSPALKQYICFFELDLTR